MKRFKDLSVRDQIRINVRFRIAVVFHVIGNFRSVRDQIRVNVRFDVQRGGRSALRCDVVIIECIRKLGSVR